MLLTILVFLLILSVLVLIHEAGHYFVAKKFGIKVEEFGFGLPPRLLGKKIGETIYSINWLPIGGFVKLYGEDDAGAGRVSLKKKEEHTSQKKEDLDRAFFSRSIWQRFSVVVAGVVMNALLAIAIYYVFIVVSGFTTELPLLNNHKFFLVNQRVTTEIIISDVSKNSPAEKAGITPFSKVTAINGQQVKTTEAFVKIINANRGKPVTLSWQDEKTQKIAKATLVPRVNPPKNQGALGVSFFPVDTAVLSYDTPVQKILSGITHPANLMIYNFDVLGSLVGVSVKEKTVAPLSQGVSGPVGIYSIVGTIIHIPNAKERILQILNLSGLLSISLAFFNVLPIPGLDGGRLLFIVIEAVTRKKVNPKTEALAHSIGIALLIALIILVTFKDINQFFR